MTTHTTNPNIPILRALGDETRWNIMAQLMNAGDCGVNIGALVNTLAIPQPTVSKHVRILERAGLLTKYKKGTLVFCRVHPDAKLLRGVIGVGQLTVDFGAVAYGDGYSVDFAGDLERSA